MRNIGGRTTPGLLEQLGLLGRIGEVAGEVPGGVPRASRGSRPWNILAHHLASALRIFAPTDPYLFLVHALGPGTLACAPYPGIERRETLRQAQGRL